MQKLVTAIVCFSLCAVMAAGEGRKDKEVKIEGKWAATGGSHNGKKIPGEAFEKLMAVIAFKDGKYSSTIMGKEDEAGTYTMDAKKDPVQVDFKITEGKDKGKTQLGILKIDGDTMTVANAMPGAKDRPKNFDGGEGVAVLTLKRQK
jgi:uncharacterized protein (TIGR03067 family)